MKFTANEIKTLTELGFEKSPAPNRYEYTDGIIVLVIEQTSENEFTLYNDMCDDDDLLKANNNFTLTEIAFDEAIEKIKETI